jgi:hypothetical protein
MDSETKQLLEELKATIDGNKKPFFQNILQSIIVALIVAIPTIIMVGNKFENRVLQMELEQHQIVKDLSKREFKIDYNFQLIENKHPELKFIKITEDNQ